jgi:hypothetical protein
MKVSESLDVALAHLGRRPKLCFVWGMWLIATHFVLPFILFFSSFKRVVRYSRLQQTVAESDEIGNDARAGKR